MKKTDPVKVTFDQTFHEQHQNLTELKQKISSICYVNYTT